MVGTFKKQKWPAGAVTPLGRHHRSAVTTERSHDNGCIVSHERSASKGIPLISLLCDGAHLGALS